ncbi:hypothetical protein [Streptomyces sp. H-KF8]|uniref:hypothetical protein n=1 Tax=Streptomyces sp. H-KF8 TaxID=1727216 RepID=UPI001331B283|nr:hypothetical protein [Streptomyces sp. H-KF8]
MRRTARALSLAAAVGTVLGVLTPTASADPSAEVSPGSAAPGGTVTVSVLCDPADGPPPKTLEAASEAFDEGVVELEQVTGGDAEESGPVYRGTADIQDAGASGDPDETGGSDETRGPDETGETGDTEDRAGAGDEASEGTSDEEAEAGADDVEDTGDDLDEAEDAGDEAEDAGSPADGAPGTLGAFGAPDTVGTAGEGPARTVEGTCPAAPGEKGEPWNAAFTVAARHPGGSGATPPSHEPSPSHKPFPPRKPSPSYEPSPSRKPSPPPAPSSSACSGPERAHCGRSEVPRGVRAGAGGGFTDSVPALVAGGLLIAAAFGAAAHRLYRDRSTRTDG